MSTYSRPTTLSKATCSDAATVYLSRRQARTAPVQQAEAVSRGLPTAPRRASSDRDAARPCTHAPCESPRRSAAPLSCGRAALGHTVRRDMLHPSGRCLSSGRSAPTSPRGERCTRSALEALHARCARAAARPSSLGRRGCLSAPQTCGSSVHTVMARPRGRDEWPDVAFSKSETGGSHNHPAHLRSFINSADSV